MVQALLDQQPDDAVAVEDEIAALGIAVADDTTGMVNDLIVVLIHSRRIWYRCGHLGGRGASARKTRT